MMWRRRQLMIWIGRTALMAATTGAVLPLSGCQGNPPQSFRLGAVVSPPQGCSMLRYSDPLGDC